MVWFEAGWERWVDCAGGLRSFYTASNGPPYRVQASMLVCVLTCLLTPFVRCRLRLPGSSISSVFWVNKASCTQDSHEVLVPRRIRDAVHFAARHKVTTHILAWPVQHIYNTVPWTKLVMYGTRLARR